MQSEEEGGLVLAKLDDGEDLFGSLKALAAKHRIESGTVLWGIGMVREYELGYFDRGDYLRRAFFPPAELVALHGSLTMTADPPVHVHLAAAGKDHAVVGGHLFKATVNVLNELCLRRLDEVRLTRERNPRSGLNELCVLR
ncbi:MAG TPA: DUF296 domain-containing protein [Thermoplasmata archaeon]|nr:DUF296 domain-containing protein [Thermoplasmata archaeon]